MFQTPENGQNPLKPVPSLNRERLPPSLLIINDVDAVRSQAVIYKKQDITPLTDYQKRINEEAQNFCENNPSMLRNRSKLLEVARARVNENYQFKKGASRSKKVNPSSSIESIAKRRNFNQSTCLERMNALEKEIKGAVERISYKERCRMAAENYHLCDEITEEISELMRQKR